MPQNLRRRFKLFRRIGVSRENDPKTNVSRRKPCSNQYFFLIKLLICLLLSNDLHGIFKEFSRRHETRKWTKVSKDSDQSNIPNEQTSKIINKIHQLSRQVCLKIPVENNFSTYKDSFHNVKKLKVIIID